MSTYNIILSLMNVLYFRDAMIVFVKLKYHEHMTIVSPAAQQIHRRTGFAKLIIILFLINAELYNVLLDYSDTIISIYNPCHY